jgi:ribulose-5-phosphate 4-epimerase/fuculose-1-phosphate aldolase
MAVLHTARVLGALLGSTPIERSVIDDLVAANRILANQQVVDAFGHVSVRHRSNAQRFLMGRNLAPALVTANDIVEYDLDGNAIGAKPGFTHILERFIHAEIYRMRSDVNSVVHSHSSAIMPFANIQVPLRPMFHIAAFLAPNVPIFEISQATGAMTNMLIADGKLGQSLAETLGQNAVVLMRGHGGVIVAASLSLAVFRAVYTDINARMQMQAMAAGGPITFLDLEEAEKATKVIDQIHTRAWDLWSRSLWQCGLSQLIHQSRVESIV